MNDRVLRDELEQLQTKRHGLEAELRVAHTADFLAKRASAMATLARARGELAEVERKFLQAREEENAIATQVEKLSVELRALEQRRLSAIPFVLLPVAFFLTGLVFSEGLPPQPFAFVAAMGLGLLFGPQLLRWAKPGATRERSVWSDVIGNYGIFPFLLAIFGVLPAATVAWKMQFESWTPDSDDQALFATYILQAPSVLSVVLAIRGRRKVQEEAGSGLELANVAAVMSLLALALISTIAWDPIAWDLLHRRTLERLAVDGQMLLSIPPLLLALWASRDTKARHWSLLGGSLVLAMICATFVLSILLKTHSDHALGDLIRMVAAVQAAAGSMMLGLDFARREETRLPTLRWLGVGAAAVSITAIFPVILVRSS